MNRTRLLQSMLANMGDGVVVADEAGNVLLFNPAAERILGVGLSDSVPQESIANANRSAIACKPGNARSSKSSHCRRLWKR